MNWYLILISQFVTFDWNVNITCSNFITFKSDKEKITLDITMFHLFCLLFQRTSQCCFYCNVDAQFDTLKDSFVAIDVWLGYHIEYLPNIDLNHCLLCYNLYTKCNLYATLNVALESKYLKYYSRPKKYISSTLFNLFCPQVWFV
jgi:hypothetical protein